MALGGLSNGQMDNRCKLKFWAESQFAQNFHEFEQFLGKACSWLNPIEVWFSILDQHVLRRGNFSSISDLKEKIQRYITYYNGHLAKAWRWSVTKTRDIQQLLEKIICHLLTAAS